MRILIIEDDIIIANNLREILEKNLYNVEIALDGEEGLNLALFTKFDLIILDLNLPKIDGIKLCRILRENQCNSLILMLTARDTNLDQIIGLDAGADDYIVKPFDLKVLLARIRALLRRNTPEVNNLLLWGDLVLDPNKFEVKYKDNIIPLTKKEYQLLELFLLNPHRTLTKEFIIDQLWPFEDTPQEDTVRAHIKKLRKKLKEAGVEQDVIENIYGIGYRLKPPI